MHETWMVGRLGDAAARFVLICTAGHKKTLMFVLSLHLRTKEGS